LNWVVRSFQMSVFLNLKEGFRKEEVQYEDNHNKRKNCHI
jgi:hypothetical protein